MIDIETTLCPCGKPIVQSSRQKRRYCNDACKQAAYRERAEQMAREHQAASMAELEEQIEVGLGCVQKSIIAL